MDYQELYSKYQTAIKLRELSTNPNFELLKNIFEQKVLEYVSDTYEPSSRFFALQGQQEVFHYVYTEAKKVEQYREELDKMFEEESR